MQMAHLLHARGGGARVLAEALEHDDRRARAVGGVGRGVGQRALPRAALVAVQCAARAERAAGRVVHSARARRDRVEVLVDGHQRHARRRRCVRVIHHVADRVQRRVLLHTRQSHVLVALRLHKSEYEYEVQL